MKKLILLFMFCVSSFAFSQEMKRENITGKIIVEGVDIEGITIYNTLSKMGAVTNEEGEFTIAVSLNDVLEVRALEYQKLDVHINKTILESKKVHVFLIEEINTLDEVIVRSKKLTGNLSADLKRVNTFNQKLDAIYFGIKNEDAYQLKEDFRDPVNPITTEVAPQTLVHGLNIVNIVDQLLIPLFRSEVKDKKAAGIPEVPSKSIKYYLGANFLTENFSIPEHRVEEFIRYVEDATFDFDLLNYGYEIQFLELLNFKSKEFLESKNTVD
jgi:hypothetical protein